MSVLLICPHKDPTDWQRELRQQLPETRIDTFPEVADARAVEYAVTWKHPRGIFRNYPNLKVVASMGAGVDHITSDPDLPQNIQITRVVDEQLSADMSVFVLALILEYLRNLAPYRTTKAWSPKSYARTEDTKIGIMGLGVLGTAVGKTLVKNGFQVSGWSRTPSKNNPIKSFYGEHQLHKFLSESNILVCLLPLTRETENILNKELFAKLPKGAYLINVARGEHLVEHDLIEMIEKGHLAGASLDVFKKEPLPQEHPFWKHPKIQVSPHVASVTNPTSATAQIADNYHRMKAGKPLKNVIQKEKGY